jgi:glucose-1-phosphate thymidylyltransferase
LHSERTIDAIRLDGWRSDIGYLGARDQAEKRLQGEIDPEMAAEAIQVDGK